MNLYQRIRQSLTEQELKLVKRSVFFRIIEGFAVSSQTCVLLAAIYYIYEGGSDPAYFVGFSLAIVAIFFVRRVLIFTSIHDLFSISLIFS